MYLFYRYDDKVLIVKVVILNKYLILFLIYYRLKIIDCEKVILVKLFDLNFFL